MSWRDALQPPSFRGVRFAFQKRERTGGRRLATAEFPQRDVPWTEDLGRKARRFTVEAVIVGADYIDRANALVDALEAYGPGQLVLPTRGNFTVEVEDFTESETTAEGGMATFSMVFVEAGEPLGPDARTDTASAATATADGVSGDALARFTKSFSVAGAPAFVEAAAAKLLGRFGVAAAGAALLLGGSGRTLRAFEAGIGLLPAGALTLVRSAINTATSVQAIVAAIGALGGSPAPRVLALRRVIADPADWPPVIGDTPVRAIERINRAELAALVVASAAAEAVRASAAVSFASYEDAVRFRESLGDDLDQAAIRAADTGDDQHAADLDSLRRVMVRDVTTRGGSLARLYQFAPRTTEPALVIAHRLYGAANTAVRTDEIVARNRIRHPGFVPGGRALEVRTPETLGVANG